MLSITSTILKSGQLTGIAFLKAFDRENNYIVQSFGTYLKFRIFPFQLNLMELDYNIYNDVLLLIPYEYPDYSILLVIMASAKFCLLKYQNGNIICIQKGEITSSFGSDIGSKYSYSLFKSLLLIQIYQEGLQLYLIKNEKLIFIENFDFFASVILQFQLIDSNHFSVLLRKFQNITSYEVYQFNLLQFSRISETSLLKDYHNFMIWGKKIFAIGSNNFLEIKKGKISDKININYNEKIYDAIPINNANILIITISGVIYFLHKISNNISIEKLGNVEKPLKTIRVSNGNDFIIPSKIGPTKIFRNGTLHTLFDLPGKIIKFPKISPRRFLGLTKTKLYYDILFTLILETCNIFSFEYQVKSWIFNDDTILVTNYSSNDNSNYTSLYNLTLKEKIDHECNFMRDSQTIGFQKINRENFVQITNNKIFFSTNNSVIQFEKISSYSFSDDSFVICDNNTNLYLYTYDGKELSRVSFEFQINSLALCDRILAISSWETSSVYIYFITNSLFYLFKIMDNISIVDLVFINNKRNLVALSHKDFCYVYDLKEITNEISCVKPENFIIECQINDHDIREQNVLIKNLYSKENIIKIFCCGFHSSLCKLSENEVLIYGEENYILKDLVATKVKESKSVCYSNFFNNNLLVSYNDNTIALYKNLKYDFAVNLKTNSPYQILNIIPLKNNLFIMVIFHDNQYFIAKTKNTSVFEKYQTLSKIGAAPRKFIEICEIKGNDSFYELHVAAIFNTTLSIYCIKKHEILEKASFTLRNVPIGAFYSNGHLSVIFSDSIQLLSYDGDNITIISDTPTQGSSKCFSFSQSYLAIGDKLESLVLYKLDNNYFQDNAKKAIYSEKYRDCHEMGISSCIDLGDNKWSFCVDESCYLYQFKKVDMKNFSSNNLVIEKACSIGSPASSMAFISEANCILIGLQNGVLIKLKWDININDANASNEEVLHGNGLVNSFLSFYTSLEENFVSFLGNFEISCLKQIVCSNYTLGIPKIIDINLIDYFLHLNVENKAKIIERSKSPFSLELIESLCDKIILESNSVI
ncbi:hypothetical protein TRFO_31332 [Tritrichomonas foetus]|uniref:Cleavage/polyadenylation specificity factor A subunit C-terminal domain-containing protein n=1 Tax=Tritrichomonas foetus TaxID=1144522 RepID=A0A1J4JSI4_9EUKA|nr:hypothetical protein TRFO_31332 [Tritrichomonas foetus]|eukprot:OHT01722.1 hypothetical protein TRFO_31332 [Tritrichomonas foetus]